MTPIIINLKYQNKNCPASIEEERAWHPPSGWCKSCVPVLSARPCLGVWVWSWIIWIQSPVSALTWIPLTIAQWTLSLWPVTRSPAGEIIYETNSASENSPDKDRVDIIFHSHFRRIHFHFFYTAGRGGQHGDGDTRPIMEFLSSWLSPQLCSHFKPLPSLPPTYCIAVIR